MSSDKLSSDNDNSDNLENDKDEQITAVLDNYKSLNSSRRSSIASTLLKLKKVINFPEIINERGEEEYVFDKKKQIWRTKKTGSTTLLPKNDDAPKRSNSFFTKYQFINRTKSIPIINSATTDWILLATLGILMGFLSYGMDVVIHFLQHSRNHIMHIFTGNILIRYFAWILFCIILVLIAATICRKLAVQAIGSGIPEIKTIIRGVMLKEYLTFKTLVAKVVGLCLSLSSGVPIGKEGPFVHIGSIVAHLLSKISKNLQGCYGNESRRSEMLAAGVSVGVSCTFSSPVGGVLYSIEATSVYFGMRNYARCFLAATFSATIFRILQVISNSDAVVALYQTNFPKNCYGIEEIPLFVILGIICGLAAAVYIYFQRHAMYFARRPGLMKIIFQKYWFMYPLIIVFIYSSLTFPDFIGQYFAGGRLFGETVRDFFGNCSWILTNTNSTNACTNEQLGVWSNYGKSHPFQVLLFFFLFFFNFVVICSTLPIPVGAFVPTFVIGGAIGRLYGEILVYLLPNNNIYPGIYAVIGAAGFCGGSTHSVSVAVILYEVTGQLEFALPILIGVLAAHATTTHLQPSIYDSVIKIKKLPYLKDISHISRDFIGIEADQFMISDVKFISKDSTLAEIRDLIIKFPRVQTFPICDSHKNQILIGSCGRDKLVKLLRDNIGHKARIAEASRRANLKTNQRDSGLFNTSSNGIPTNGTTHYTPNLINSRAETEVLLDKSGHDEDNKSLPGRLINFTRQSMRRLSRPNTAAIIDMTNDEKDKWETEKLSTFIDLDSIEFDSAPFMLVENSPLLHVHMMFSLLGLQRAYITKCGKLIGLISMRDLRTAIESVKNGHLYPKPKPRERKGTIDPALLSNKQEEIDFNT